MRRHFVSGFPRALLSLSQEKSSGVEIEQATASPFPSLNATTVQYKMTFSVFVCGVFISILNLLEELEKMKWKMT